MLKKLKDLEDESRQQSAQQRRMMLWQARTKLKKARRIPIPLVT